MNIRIAVLMGLAGAGAAWAQLPAGAGREEVQKVCSSCHELERSVSLRQDRDGWKTTVNKMISMGAQISEAELGAVIEYLADNYPSTSMPKLNVNKARAVEFEARLTLRRSESAAIVKYRAEHGDFKSVEDFEKVPGIDFAKIRAKKDILTF